MTKTVLLTRPDGRNQAMIDLLESSGVHYVVTPLLAIEPTYTNPTFEFGQFDHIIFISTNAVHYANHVLPAIEQANCQCYAVGQATFDALIKYQILPKQAPADNQKTEGLLSLPELQDLTDQKVLIIRGVGGRETLAEQLSARGAHVDYWEVYQRVCPQLDAQAVALSWQSHNVDTLTVTSGAILENLIALTPKELFPWLRACHIIVPSSRVAEQAKKAGFHKITNAKSADSKSMCNAMGLHHITD